MLEGEVHACGHLIDDVLDVPTPLPPVVSFRVALELALDVAVVGDLVRRPFLLGVGFSDFPLVSPFGVGVCLIYLGQG